MNIAVQKPLVHKTVNLNQVWLFLYLANIVIVPFLILYIHKRKIQLHLYFNDNVPVSEGLHAYPFDHEAFTLYFV